MLFHFSRFYVITRDTEFRYTMQPSIFPEGVCVCACDGERPCESLCEALTTLLCFLPMLFLVYVCMCSHFRLSDCSSGTPDIKNEA